MPLFSSKAAGAPLPLPWPYGRQSVQLRDDDVPAAVLLGVELAADIGGTQGGVDVSGDGGSFGGGSTGDW